MPPKKTILFVGAFNAAIEGVVGGQLVSCRLLANSPLAQAVNLRLVDTTMKSIPPPGFWVRAWHAGERLLKVVGEVIFGRIDGLYVFAPFAASGFIDRGLMCIVGRLFRKRVVMSPRSEIRPPARAPWLARGFIRLVLRCCDAVHCQNAIAAERLSRDYGYDRGRIVVIPNWIDASAYAQTAARRAQRAPSPRPVVLFMAWIERSKGIFELTDAARRLRQRGLQFRLIVCGSGSQYDALVQHVRREGLADTVEFRGWVNEPDKHAALAEADLFVLPSYHEGLPNALIEAMASGLPVVATPVGGIPCLVEPGRNGFLVPPRDPEQLADALETLLRDEPLRRTMGSENRRQIEDQQDLARVWPRIATMLTGDKVSRD